MFVKGEEPISKDPLQDPHQILQELQKLLLSLLLLGIGGVGRRLRCPLSSIFVTRSILHRRSLVLQPQSCRIFASWGGGGGLNDASGEIIATCEGSSFPDEGFSFFSLKIIKEVGDVSAGSLGDHSTAIDSGSLSRL